MAALYTGKKEKYLNCLGDKALGDENTHQHMVSSLIPHGSIDQSPNHAQPLVSSGHTYRSSLLSSKGLSLPVSHDENSHYGVPCSPYLAPPPTDMDKPQSYKWNPGTKKLYGCDTVHPGLTDTCLYRDKTLLAKATCPAAKKTCRACAVPNRCIIHCHELVPKFLSRIDISFDVLRESDLLPETVFDVSKYMFHEGNIPIDSGYHSPHHTVPAHLDVSSYPVAMVLISANKVTCPFPKGGTLLTLPCNKDKILPSVLC